MTIRAPLFTPIARAVGQASFIPVVSLALLAGPGPTPFAQHDWPNPKPAIARAAYGEQPPNLALTTLAAAAQPTILRAPLITRIATPQTQAPFQPPNVLIHAGLVVTPPVAPIDWPNPKPSAQRNQPDFAQNLLATTLNPSQTQYMPAAAYLENAVFPPRASQTDQPPNLVLHAQPAAMPFAQHDWPNPTLPRQVQQPPLYQSALTTPPGPPSTAAPFVPQVWPNPVVVFPRQTPFELNLQTTTLQPGFAPAFTFSENGARPVTPIQAHPPANTLPLYSAPVGMPFAQYDWKNPVVALARQSPFELNLLGTTLAPTFQPAFSFSENVVFAPRAGQAHPPANTLALYATPVIPPLLPVDLTVNAKPFPAQLQQAVNLKPLQSIPVLPPLLPVDLTVNAKPFGQVQEHPPNLTAFLPVGAQPFAQHDWQNPIPARGQQIPPPANIALANPAIPPISRLDWKNPPPAFGQQIEYPPNLVLFQPVAPLPFNQMDWRASVFAWRGQPSQPMPANLLLEQTPNPQPPTQTDWPNPRVPVWRNPPPFELNLTLILTPPPVTGGAFTNAIIVRAEPLSWPYDLEPEPYGEFYQFQGTALAFGIDFSALLANRWSCASLVTVGTTIRPTTENGYQYVCSTAGASGAKEPAWPSYVGATVVDGSAIWTCASLSTASLAGTLQSASWSGALTLIGPSIADQTSLITINSGNGVAGTNYLISCTAQFSNGQEVVGKLLIKVR